MKHKYCLLKLYRRVGKVDYQEVNIISCNESYARDRSRHLLNYSNQVIGVLYSQLFDKKLRFREAK